MRTQGTVATDVVTGHGAAGTQVPGDTADLTVRPEQTTDVLLTLPK